MTKPVLDTVLSESGDSLGHVDARQAVQWFFFALKTITYYT
jgi:hypothetical protein